MTQSTSIELHNALRIAKLVGTPEAARDLRRMRDRKTTWIGRTENTLRSEIDHYLRETLEEKCK